MFTHIVGLGAVCANGLSKEAIFASCAASETFIQNNGLASLTTNQWAALNETTPLQFCNSKSTLLSYRAMTDALKDAGWSRTDLDETGFIYASTTSQIDEWEDHLPFYQRREADAQKIKAHVSHQSLGAPLLNLAKHFGINGPRTSIASSCSASLQALALAFSWISSGRVKRCLVGGTEINNKLTRIGFGSLRLLSTSQSSPFDKNRNGINLGEGSSFLCLEEFSIRSENRWGFLTGAGLTSDAYHATSPHPEGLGSKKSMLAALQKSRLQPHEIDWIYAHGTGSPANDSAEANAIYQVFPQLPPVTSTKSSHGHTLAASGAIEASLGLMAMKKNLVLPTVHFQTQDPAISLNICSQPMQKHIQHFLKNSLGFGGINASLVFSKEVGPR